MKIEMLQINLWLAWLWLLLGFASGAILGMCFHREDWLGGYASHRRRLYRLGHISFFGLAVVNLLFVLTVREFFPGANGGGVWFASRAFVLGAVAMPLCCVVAAHRKDSRMLFSIPVTSLLAGGVAMFLEVIKL